MTHRFANKVALVTGGASGIGAATVERLSREGALVMVADISKPCGPLPCDGKRVHFVQGDVSSPAGAEALVKATVEAFGRLDILVNSAGIGALVPTESETAEHWRATMGVNCDGVFYMAQAAIRQMLAQESGGTVVNVASVHGLVGFANHAAYTASKGAVVNMTKSLAVEYASRGIRVNAVCPGFVMTPMIEAGVSDELMPQVVALHPIGRIGNANEIADPIAFVASDEASFMTGSSLVVDGGYTAY